MAFVSSTLFSLAPSTKFALCSRVSNFRGSTLGVIQSRRVTMTMNLDTIQTRIQEEMKKAQEATAKFGKSSKEAATAWDIVEELEAQASHMKAERGTVDPLDEYCDDSPEADECRVYEA